MLDLDLDQASRWIAALAGVPSASMCWQTFEDGKDKRAALTSCWHGSLVQSLQHLRRLADQGAGVFATVNLVRAKMPRRVQYIERVRALFVDCDGFEPAAWHLPPSMLVRSGGGGVHGYWLVTDCEKEKFAGAQRKLAQHYGSDPKVCDLPRVLRVPGTWHLKGQPRPVELVACNGTQYPLATVIGDLAPVHVPVRPSGRPLRDVRTVIDWRGFDVVTAFADAGFYRRPLGEDKHAVICPWSGTHTAPDWRSDSADTSTVVWQGPPATFHCSHAHCDGKRLRDALCEIGYRPSNESVAAAQRQKLRSAVLAQAHRTVL